MVTNSFERKPSLSTVAFVSKTLPTYVQMAASPRSAGELHMPSMPPAWHGRARVVELHPSIDRSTYQFPSASRHGRAGSYGIARQNDTLKRYSGAASFHLFRSSSRAHRSSKGTSQGAPPATPFELLHCRKPAHTAPVAGSLAMKPLHGSLWLSMPAYVSCTAFGPWGAVCQRTRSEEMAWFQPVP